MDQPFTIDGFFQNTWVRAVIVLAIGVVIYSLCMMFVKKMLKKSKIDTNAHAFIRSLVKVVLIVVLIFTLLSVGFNVNITSFVAVFSVVGVAISLAIQDSLSNLAGGAFLLLSKPFTKGDFVTVDQISGTIDEIGLVYTKILTKNNASVFIPNSQMSKSVVENTNVEETARLDLTFTISYESDLLLAKELLKEISLQSHLTLPEEEPFVAVDNLGESGVDLLLRVWCETENKMSLKYYLNEQVKLEFERQNIEIPYQKIDIQVKKEHNV